MYNPTMLKAKQIQSVTVYDVTYTIQYNRYVNYTLQLQYTLLN